jgi:hypothetical protein
MFLVLSEPLLEQVDGRDEVPTEGHQDVDIVPVAIATEAVSQIVAWIHGGSKFFATGTLKTEVAFDLLRDGTVLAKPLNGDLHRQVVANRTQ